MPILFWIALGVVALFLGCHLFGWIYGYMVMGQPIPGWWSALRHNLLRLKGASPVSEDFVLIEGYIYKQLTYSNGSIVNFRK